METHKTIAEFGFQVLALRAEEGGVHDKSILVDVSTVGH